MANENKKTPPNSGGFIKSILNSLPLNNAWTGITQRQKSINNLSADNKKTPTVTHGGTIVLTDEQKVALKKDPAGVIAKIIKQQASLYSKSMTDWLAARAQAENVIYPQRTLLYDLYHDLMLDGFFHGQFYNHRVLPIKNKAFKIMNAQGEPQPEKTKMLQRSWFYNLLLWYMEAKLYGYSLPYINEIAFDGKTSWIKDLVLLPRKHVHPEQHIITSFQSQYEGLDYTKDPVSKYVFPIGDPFDLGLLNIAAPLLIIKKHSWQSWDQFEEMFGIPIRVAKTAVQDARVQAEIQNWLINMGQASYAIFPEGTEIDIKENKQTDSFSVFQEKIKQVNEELAILICGQTMTSMNGSSRSQGEVHERVMAEITKDDECGFRTMFDEQWLPMLRDIHGYPFDIGDSFEWDEPKDLQNLLKIYEGVNGMGFQLDQEQVEEIFGVKILGLKAPSLVPAIPDSKTPELEPTDPKDPDKDDDRDLAVKDILKMHALIQKGIGHVHKL